MKTANIEKKSVITRPRWVEEDIETNQKLRELGISPEDRANVLNVDVERIKRRDYNEGFTIQKFDPQTPAPSNRDIIVDFIKENPGFGLGDINLGLIKAGHHFLGLSKDLKELTTKQGRLYREKDEDSSHYIYFYNEKTKPVVNLGVYEMISEVKDNLMEVKTKVEQIEEILEIFEKSLKEA